jgi:hypothetical protein
MASNPFDQFDAPAVSGGNPFDQFDVPTAAQPQDAEQGAAQGERSFMDDAKYMLGRTARMGAEVVGAIPLAAADAGIAARNLITGSNYDSASSMYQQALDDVGLPRATTALEKGVDFVGQAVMGAKLPIPQAKTRAPTSVPIAKPNLAQQAIQSGERHGVPVFYDDVAENAFSKKLGVAAESLGPLGTGSGREKQVKAAQTAAQKVADNFSIPDDDIPKAVQEGLKNRLAGFRKTANVLYARAAQELDTKGQVTTTRFDQALDAQITKQARFGAAANKELIATLESYKNAPRGDFSYMRELRSQVGGEISKYYGGGKAIGDKGVEALEVARRALETDMEDFARAAGGKAFQNWRNADGFYKANIVPFKEAGLKTLVKSNEPEKAWQFLVSQGSVKSRASRMYHALDSDGRAAVRYGLIKDAMSNGTNPNGSFSPAKFAKYLEDHENAVNTFFKGSDLGEIKGFQNLMRHVERAGQYAENPPTGQRVIPFLMGGAAFFEPSVASSVAASGVTVRALFQTKTGRDLLLKAASAKPGSPQMKAINQQISRYATSATLTATNPARGDSQGTGTP